MLTEFHSKSISSGLIDRAEKSFDCARLITQIETSALKWKKFYRKHNEREKVESSDSRSRSKLEAARLLSSQFLRVPLRALQRHTTFTHSIIISRIIYDIKYM